jgi:hypothetical protein
MVRPEFEPPKPLDVGVAFVSGQQQAERIALLGPQPLAFAHRRATRRRAPFRSVLRVATLRRAFGQHPFRLRLDASFRQHGR